MRSLARWGSLPLLAAPLGSWALGLGGDIETISYLNQPLNVEIPFTATAEELQSLRVGLAPVAEFSARGLEYPAVLTSMQFRVGRNAAGEDVIIVTSTESVGEPFLTILLQVTHNRGGLTREYSFLLDPPLFQRNATAPEPIAAPATRPAAESVAGGAIQRPPAEAPRPAQAPTQQAPAQQAPRQAPVAQPGAQAVGNDGASYTVQGGDTLWSIAERYRPAGVSTNQAMLAIFESNQAAFEGNINLMRRGSILRIPPATTLGATSATAATAEVRRQIEAWRASGGTASPQLILIPPGDEASPAIAGAGAGDPARVTALENQIDSLEAQLAAARAEAAEANRLLELQSADLANLQNQAAAEPSPAEVAPPAAAEDPIFAEDPAAAEAGVDETVVEEPVAAAVSEPEPTPAIASPPPPVSVSEPSMIDRVLTQLMRVREPIVYIPVAIVLLVIAALAFLRRRRGDVDDVTGQWEALEAEIDEEADHAATARIRARSREPDMVVVEGDRDDETAEERRISGTAELAALDSGTAEIAALTMDDDEDEAPRPRPQARRREEPSVADQTMSSQTVINLDQADPIAEADFHMAYGLYDQAADLITKALSADPNNRGLKQKLLEVYFVWGNKESFLESAQKLKKEVGGGPDWDKIVIMGKQICPDEPLFSEATASAGEIDLDLESSAEAPGLDFAFDDADDDGGLDFGLDDDDDGGLSLAASGSHPTAASPRSSAAADDDMLDIGAQTQAGLEAALLDDLDEAGGRTMPGDEISDLDSTMESPTVETEAALDDDDFGGLTLESPTVEAPGPDAPTVETPTIESPAGGFGDTVEQRRPVAASTADMTAEIELDDLGLDVSELENIGDDIIDLSMEDSDADDDLLSATGVTQVLHDDDGEIDFSGTEVLEDDEATMLAPGFDAESTGVRTEVLEQKPSAFDPDPPATEDDLDLNLEDFSSALDGGADTVEQPMASRFSGLDLDIGIDVPADDEPTGTEEFSPLDPQTMTEVGTKLDLARAYIDMGDPEGAKSILEEVLNEGDAGQRSEAQALIDALPA